jgi:hypothetical protein
MQLPRCVLRPGCSPKPSQALLRYSGQVLCCCFWRIRCGENYGWVAHPFFVFRYQVQKVSAAVCEVFAG